MWLGGNGLSLLGNAVFYFALGWAASAHGGRWTGAVLTAIVVPRVLSTILGGVAGDRLGVRKVMRLVSDGAVVVSTSLLALTVPAPRTRQRRHHDQGRFNQCRVWP